MQELALRREDSVIPVWGPGVVVVKPRCSPHEDRLMWCWCYHLNPNGNTNTTKGVCLFFRDSNLDLPIVSESQLLLTTSSFASRDDMEKQVELHINIE